MAGVGAAIKGIGEVKSDKYIMDIETYNKVHQKKFKSKNRRQRI